MPKEPKRRMSRGICHFCGQEFSKNTISRHLDKCWAELAAKEKYKEKYNDLLVRNEAPVIACDECGQEADWIGTYGKSYETRTICDAFVEKKHLTDARLLPLVNSPRTGVCGYVGV